MRILVNRESDDDRKQNDRKEHWLGKEKLE